MRKFILSIVDKSVDEKDGQIFFHVKTLGKNEDPSILNANYLFNNIKMLENFSPLDVREIARAAIGYIEEIDAIFFKKEDTIFRVYNRLTGMYKDILAADLACDDNTLANLSKEDLCKVSYQLRVNSFNL